MKREKNISAGKTHPNRNLLVIPEIKPIFEQIRLTAKLLINQISFYG